MRVRVAVALALLALVPGIVSAQQTNGVIAGKVTDATGGVLPGVTVEVASPALIEKVRSVVTGDDGQFRVVELRPGEYSVTFTLAGFGKFVRENVQITSGFTATVNGELKVGDMAETITVTGGSPVVDLQNVTQQSVLSKTTLDAIPTGRNYTAVGKLIPGIDSTGNSGGHDVGGTTGRDATKLIYHGSATNAFKLMIERMPQMTWIADGSIGVQPSENLAEEINLQYSALPAEVETGGVLFNMVPKTGGNTFKGNVFGDFATSAMQADNLTDVLRAQGLGGGNVDYVMDVAVSVGGPIKTDKLWFFATYRDLRPDPFSTMYFDANTKDYVYTPDTSKDPALDAKPQKSLNARVTLQATPRNRLNVGLDLSKIITYNYFVGGKGGTTQYAPEAVTDTPIVNKPVVQGGWTVPVNSRLLIDVGGQVFRGRWRGGPNQYAVAPPAVELGTSINFRSAPALGSVGYVNLPFWHDYFRGAVSYTTGAHAIKVGGTLWHGGLTTIGDSQGMGPYVLRLLNGAANGVLYRVDPLSVETRFLKGALYAQDQWTLRGLTLNYGVRIDTQDSGYPAQHEVATAYFTARDFPAGTVMKWRDWSPRLGVAYDLFGNGKTAIKASYSRYVEWDATGYANTANPAQASGGTLQRSWTDRNGDFIPQGDPTNPLANGEIGVSPNANWGSPIPTTRYDPAWSQGWGIRGYNWERSVSVQQELRSNVSLNAGYFYRTYGNFSIIDNAATTASDYDTFCITGPSDPRLPAGGGNQICGLYDVKPASVSKLDNLRTSANNYGDVHQNYKGYDVTVNVRLTKALLQGGLSSGRELYDFCGVIAKLPEMLIAGTSKTPADQCHQEQPFLSQVKFIGLYQLPWAWSIAATYQNGTNTTSLAPNVNVGAPRMGIGANFVATNAQIVPSLGRNLAAGANGTATVNVVTPGTMWGDRLQQVDLRLGRTFKAGHTSIKAMLDLYNALNSGVITAYNNTYGTNGAAWLTPIAILPPRLVKVGFQLDF